MPYFNYSSVTYQGQKKKGIMTASSSREVQNRLEERREYLIHCREKTTHLRFFSSFHKKYLEEICIHFKEMSQAGIPLLDILESIKRTSLSLQFKNIFEDIYFLVRNGSLLSEAMTYYPQIFNQVFIGIIKAAEATGKLTTAFEQLANLLNEQQKFRIKVIQSLRYPTLLLGMIFLLMNVLSIFVIPQLQVLITSLEGDLPLSTCILIHVSDKFPFILLSGGLWIGISGSLLFILSWLSQRIKTYCHKIILQIPFFGAFFKEIMLFHFFQVLTLLYQNNINIIESLETAKKIFNNLFLKQKITKIIEKIRRGCGLEKAFKEEEIFASYSVRMLEIGMQTGELGPCLHFITQHYRQTIEQKISKILTYLEPAALMIMGGIMFWIVSAVFVPLYQQLTVLDL